MIQIKAKQQNVSFEKNVEKLAFVLSAHLYNTLESSKVIEEAAKRSVEAALVKKEKATSASQVLVAVKEQSKLSRESKKLSVLNNQASYLPDSVEVHSL